MFITCKEKYKKLHFRKKHLIVGRNLICRESTITFNLILENEKNDFCINIYFQITKRYFSSQLFNYAKHKKNVFL